MSDAPSDVVVEEPVEEVQPEKPVKETDWKAEARKWETRAKENAGAAKRLAEFEESQKTELQKAIDRAEKAEQVAQKFESDRQVAAWKTEVSEKSGVPAAALRGSTLEDLQAHAEELKPLLEASRRGPYVPSPGNIPDTPVSDDAAFVRSLFGGGNH